VQRVGLSLICLTGTRLGNAERPHRRRVTTERTILWRRLFMQRSTGRYLDSWCNRVYLLFCTLDTILLWLSGTFLLVQASWITFSSASTNWGSQFSSSSAAIESAPAALLFFRYFGALSITSRLGKSISTQ
jgi:hypothetical protein